MTGVEILAIEEVAISYAFNWDMYLTIVLASTIIVTTLLGMIFFNEYEFWSFVYFFIIAVIMSGLIGLIPACTTLPDEYETNYKVIISDEVSMNDFLTRYEIIEVEGQIYTVKEVDNGEN